MLHPRTTPLRRAAIPTLAGAGLLLGLLATAGGAQTSATQSTPPLPTPATPAPLSLGEALARAANAASARIAEGTARGERARVDIARRPADPLLGLGTTRYSGNRIVTLSEDIRWAGQRRFAVDAAERGAEAAALEARQAAAEARHEARARWLALARAEDAARLAQATVERARGLHDAIAAKVEGGRTPRLDLVRVDAEGKSLEAIAAAAAEERASAWASLAGLLGMREDVPGATDGERPALAPRSAIDDAADPAHAERQPAVLAARARLAEAEAGLALAGRRKLPGLNLEVGATAGDPGLPGTDASALLTLALPVGAAPAEAVATAERDTAQARLDDALRTARSDLAAAYHRTLGAMASLAAYDASALPAAEEAASLTREAFDAGRGDLIRVIEADRALLEVRAARLQAYVDSQLAWGDLLLAAGSEHAAD